MSTERELTEKYDAIINSAVTLNSKWILNQGDFNNWTLIKARENLRAICKENNLDMILIPDGEDTVLVIKVADTRELVLQIIMNLMTFESEE